MPGAISDSSTLIHLAKIGRLDLLREFHKKIFIAPAVWNEVVQESDLTPTLGLRSAIVSGCGF